jgi:hypothetical protein
MLYLRNLARKMGIVLSYTMKQIVKFKRKKKQKGGSRIGIGPLPVGPVGYQLDRLAYRGSISHGYKPWQLW